MSRLKVKCKKCNVSYILGSGHSLKDCNTVVISDLPTPVKEPEKRDAKVEYRLGEEGYFEKFVKNNSKL
jgi:hypothetical protein